MSAQLSLIESSIDVPLMDTKNISKLIDDYTVEYSTYEDPNVFFFFRDYMRELYAKSLNNIPEDGIKSPSIDSSVVFNDMGNIYHGIVDFKQMLTTTTSNFRNFRR